MPGDVNEQLAAYMEEVSRTRKMVTIIFMFVAAAFLLLILVFWRSGGGMTQKEDGLVSGVAAFIIAIWTFSGDFLPSVSQAGLQKRKILPVGSDELADMQGKVTGSLERWVPFVFAIVVMLAVVFSFASP
jgi:hypothetical protein